MIQQLLATFAPMLLGAQLILTMVLVKGEICPGQRGRVHKMLTPLVVLWLAVASLKIEAFMIAAAIGYFYSQVQTGKTREKGPLWLLYLANGLALAYVGIMMGEQDSVASAANILVQVLLLGGCFGQLLLVVARSRLQAFQRILPVVGVLAAMLTAITLVFQAFSLSEEALLAISLPTILGMILLISAVVVWCFHLFTTKAVSKGQLGFALVILVVVTVVNQPLFQQVFSQQIVS
ncbi:hypothetical protein AB4520_07190 [Vibrio renipiscarius]|uniref:hypothetical protein n=1 Tax=Vibrio renipiscarius TaxID=1461322 RepID=UPI0035526739